MDVIHNNVYLKGEDMVGLRNPGKRIIYTLHKRVNCYLSDLSFGDGKDGRSREEIKDENEYLEVKAQSDKCKSGMCKIVHPA